MLKQPKNHKPSELDKSLDRYEFIFRHITAHRFLWSFTAVCALVAWNRGLMLIYGLVAFLLSILVVCHFFRWKNLRGLAISATFATDAVFVGKPTPITLKLRSQNTQHFLQIQLLIERLSQSRDFHDRAIGHNFSTSNAFVIRSRGLQTFARKVNLPRGVYRLSSVNISSGYPLGILHKEKFATFSDSEIYVLPNQFTIAHMPINGGQHHGNGELISTARGGQEEFSSIRPYRRGDAFKTVHWGASARQMSRGKPWQVKEFVDLDMPRMVIALNQFQLTEAHAIDAMISVALSIGDCFAKKGFQVTLLGYDSFSETSRDFWQIDITASLHKDKLRKLAEIDTLDDGYNSTRFHYDDAMSALLNHIPDANVVATFTTPNHANKSDASDYLLAEKTHYRVVIGDKGNNSYREINPREHEYELNAHARLSEIEKVFAI